MATLSPLLQLLTDAEAAESLADASAYARFGGQAAELGQWALAFKAFQFARRRGQHRPPTEAEWQVLMEFEHLAALIDRASEYQRLDLLEWVCANYAGHPDLHSHAVAASFALSEFGRPVSLERVERQRRAFREPSGEDHLTIGGEQRVRIGPTRRIVFVGRAQLLEAREGVEVPRAEALKKGSPGRGLSAQLLWSKTE